MKDPHTGAVINSDVNAYKAARATVRRIRQEQEEKEQLKKRIERLESLVEKLLEAKDDNSI